MQASFSTKFQVILFSACNNHTFEDKCLEIELFKLKDTFCQVKDTWMSFRIHKVCYFFFIDNVQNILSQKN